MVDVSLRVLETPQDMAAVEELQRQVWTGNETEIVPVHMLIAVVHNGGLAVGAFEKYEEQTQSPLIGFVFGFPGLYFTPDGPRPMHCSHMLAVHPDHRNRGLGFILKRAQWQLVRKQGLDRIIWTYDPLLSRNAQLNITKLGAVCNTYLPNVYGELRDGLNVGLSTDRFQVDWWVNSQRVNRRLSKGARRPLDLAHYLAAGVEVINPTQVDEHGWPHPLSLPALVQEGDSSGQLEGDKGEKSEQRDYEEAEKLLLVEIPADFLALKAANPELALGWRQHIRLIFEDLFARGYLVTDFVRLTGTHSRSFYVLSHGESTL
jgi:predicted GNAT superfamily acetyltransferase